MTLFPSQSFKGKVAPTPLLLPPPYVSRGLSVPSSPFHVQFLAPSISADPLQSGRRISDSLPGSELEIAQFNVSGSPPSCSMELFVPYPCPSVLRSSSSWLIHKGCQQILPDLNPLVCIFALNYTQPSSLRPLLSYFSFTLSADIVYG